MRLAGSWLVTGAQRWMSSSNPSSLTSSGRPTTDGSCLNREADRREGSSQALKQMQQAAYLDAGGSEYKPRPSLPSFGFGPKAATDFERANASALESESQNRFAHRDLLAPIVGDPGHFQVDPRLLKMGFFEKLANIAGFGASVAGSFLGRGGRK